MSTVKVIGMEAAQKRLNKLPGNVRFATSRAINDMVKLVQTTTLDKTLPNAFTLRGNWQKPGNKFGVNAKFSSKTNLVGIVGSRADWLKLQEEGGTKKGQTRQAIPTPTHKPVAEKMVREKKPRALLADIQKLESERSKLKAQKRTGRYDKAEYRRNSRDLRSAKLALKHQGDGSPAFILKTRTGFVGIFKRVVTKLVLLFSLSKSAQIDPRLRFQEVSERLVREKYDETFTKRLKEALK